MDGALSRDERGRPRRMLLPNARSVIAVCTSIISRRMSTSDSAQRRGKISRYAWGDDYHDVLKEKLNALFERIKGECSHANGKLCVDTAPIMDKAWAFRAGLGWIGKSTNLITTDLGSWVFLGEIILDVDLDYNDHIVADHCGSCTACIDACPTDAITEPYVVDARKCISYATIELRDKRLCLLILKASLTVGSMDAISVRTCVRESIRKADG